MASATPSAKRKRHTAPPDTPSAAAAELLGRKLLVPAEVFPKEQPPKKGGWKAVVTTINKSNPGTVFVKFPGTPDQYYFPIEDVKRWLDPQPERKPAVAAAAAAAPAPVDPTPAVPHPSPAKSGTAAMRSTTQPAKAAAEPAAASGATGAGATGQGANKPGAAAEAAAAAGVAGERKQGQQQQQQQQEEEFDEGDMSGGSFDEAQTADGSGAGTSGQGDESGGDEEELGGEGEENGRAHKRHRAEGGFWLRDGLNMALGSAMTYALLRWMYPLDI